MQCKHQLAIPHCTEVREAKAAAEQAHREQIDNLARQHAQELQAAMAAWAAKEEAAKQLLADAQAKAKADMKVCLPMIRLSAGSRCISCTEC